MESSGSNGKVTAIPAFIKDNVTVWLLRSFAWFGTSKAERPAAVTGGGDFRRDVAQLFLPIEGLRTLTGSLAMDTLTWRAYWSSGNTSCAWIKT